MESSNKSIHTTEKTAIMVDGGFFHRRAHALWGSATPEDRATQLHAYCIYQLTQTPVNFELYRIFYYDCPPIDTSVYHPLRVDMRMGLDIQSVAFKKQVSQIILISGDSDFVPAAKAARREGIDFVLDPMEASINLDLQEHIDGLKSNSRFNPHYHKKSETQKPQNGK